MRARTSNNTCVQPTTMCRPPPTSPTSQPPPAANSDHQPHLTPDEQQGQENKKKGSLGYPFLFEVCFSPHHPFLPTECTYGVFDLFLFLLLSRFSPLRPHTGHLQPPPPLTAPPQLPFQPPPPRGSGISFFLMLARKKVHKKKRMYSNSTKYCKIVK